MNRQTSQQFKTYGAVGSPTSVGELRISMIEPATLAFWLFFSTRSGPLYSLSLTRRLVPYGTRLVSSNASHIWPLT